VNNVTSLINTRPISVIPLSYDNELHQNFALWFCICKDHHRRTDFSSVFFYAWSKWNSLYAFWSILYCVTVL